MQQNTLVTGLAILVIGLGLGYWAGGERGATLPPGGAHVMPDGSVMADANSMAGMMMDMNAALRGKTGDALDKAFIDEMIVHHEGAVEMAEILLAGTKRPELVKLGNDIITAQTGEIEMMKRWRAEWF